MADRINILALSFLYPNPAQPNHGVFVRNRLAALNQYANVTVINPLPWSPVHRWMARFAPLATVPSRRRDAGMQVYHPRFLSVPRYGKGIEPGSYYRAIQRVLSDFDPGAFDIVDMHWTFPDLPAGLRIARQLDVPSIVTLRGLEALHQQDGGVRERLVSEGLRKVNKIIALSNELKQRGDALSGDPSKSVVIRNGVDTGLFSYRSKAACRDELSMSQSETSIVTVGSLIYRKGIDLLVAAAAELREQFEMPLKVYIIGSEGPEGDYRQALFRQVEQLGLGDVIRFVGQVDNASLPTWYNACDAFCLASRGEGSPNVLTEALACGCPAVTSDVGSAREIIESEPDTGYCVPVDDVTALTQSLRDLLAASTDRRANAARFGHYDWDWCAQQVMVQYRELLEQR